MHDNHTPPEPPDTACSTSFLLQPHSELDDVLREGGRKARAVARETIDRCREATGLGRQLT